MKTELFGTDGIRARAGEFPLDETTIPALGRAIGETLEGKILVGQDTRVSSPWIFRLLKLGIEEAGSTVEDCGVLPSPAVALLTKAFGFAGGVMISASHNPYRDNGIKVFATTGRKLSDEAEASIERQIFDFMKGSRPEAPTPRTPAEARSPESGVWTQRYAELLVSRFPDGGWLAGRRIVVDCANGAMTGVAPRVLERLGAQVSVLHGKPSGTNINAGCGAVHPESLIEAMKSASADFGVAYDGDGDRSIFVSSSGRVVDGDAVLLLAARRMKRRGTLVPPLVVGTSMTNYALERKLRGAGIGLVRVSVGDRFIFEEMMRTGSVLGGEPSGHIIFSDFRLSGDGLLTTLKVAEALATERASLDHLTHDWEQAPQLLENVRVRERIPLETLPAVQAKIAEIQRVLEGYGRIVVRYSGTEPLLRVMIESDDALKNRRYMDELADAIRADLGDRALD